MKTYRLCIMALLCLFFLSGCGGQKEKEEQEKLPVVDWQVNGFAVTGEVVEEQGLWVEKYIPWNHDGVTWDKETEYLSGSEDAVDNSKIFRLSSILRSGNYEISKCFLETFDVESMETSAAELDLKKLEITDSKGSRKMLWDMNFAGEDSLAFHVIDVEEIYEEANGWPRYRQISNDIIYLGAEGEKESVGELLPFLLEKEIVREVDDTIATGEWNCDGFGNNYIRTGPDSNPYQKLYILDKEGELIMEHEASGKEQILTCMKTAEGELIFCIWSNETRCDSLVWFDVKNKQAHTLATLEGELIIQLYGMQGNDLYYQNRLGIVKWDIATGIRQLVFRLDENGIDNGFQTMMVMREDRPPMLRIWGDFNEELEDWLVVLAQEPVDRLDAIRMVSLAEESNRVKTSVAVASRKNPNSAFAYESRGKTDADDYRTRIIAELAAGGGPELMYVSLEDMELLYQRGMLADIRDYVKQETLDGLLHGVLEMGTVDGCLVGVAPEISANSIRVGKDTWSKDSWTLDEIVELMDSGKLEGRMFYQGSGGYYGPWAVIRWMVIYSLEDSFLIDWEKGESHFDDERFIRLMECIGKYEDITYDGPWDERIQGGGSLMVFEQVTLGDVSQYMGSHGADSSHYVGFPTERGNGNYLEAPGVIVVNKNAADSAAVSAYLECLLGKAVQMQTDGFGLPVIPLPTEDIWYNPITGEGRWMGKDLKIFEDGTNSIQEANVFLNQCVPAPRRYADIESIMDEELKAYFAGDKSAKQVAEIIDRRVQVFLDETE